MADGSKPGFGVELNIIGPGTSGPHVTHSYVDVAFLDVDNGRNEVLLRTIGEKED